MSGIINSSKDNAYKEIFCFSIIQQGKVAPIPEAEEEFEMIFACNSQAEAQAWVSSINSISGISSTAVTDTIVITKPIRSAGGGSVNSSQDADSDNDEITSESMRRKIQAYMLNWLSLAPDDMELAHRYFCRSLQYSGTFEHAISKGMRNPFVNSPSVFPLAMKNSNTELDAVGLREPGEPYISVTLLSARNLTHADSSSSFDIISGLYYMYCDLWVSPIKSPRLRSSKQPSVEHPVFRDELSFPLHGSFASDEIDNIYINKLVPVLSPPKLEADILSAANKIFLHCNVYNHKPLSIGDDELIGSTTISIKRLGFTSSPSEPIYEWFPLLDNKGEPVLDSAAVRLKVQLLN